MDSNRDIYTSDIPGTLGGYRRGKLYGKLDCPSALRAIAQGGYIKYRVFFLMKKQQLQLDIVHAQFVYQKNMRSGKTLKKRNDKNV